MNKEDRIRQLNEIAMKGTRIARLRESDEWGATVDAVMQDVEANLNEILEPSTSSQRYYELRAEINAVKKLFDIMATKQARAQIAAKQKRQLEES